MNENSMAIAILCSHLCAREGIFPLEPKEWSDFAAMLLDRNMQPAEVLSFSLEDFRSVFGMEEANAERYLRLLDRSASLSFEMSKYANMGIELVTRADSGYPSRLKKILGNGCPPLFYYAGELQLLEKPFIGYVGSRTITERDQTFTQETVEKTVQRGYGVVSGGARGVDSIAEEQALSMGGCAMAYLSDSMVRKLKKGSTVQAILDKKLLYLSVVKPDAGFNAGIAMMRNKYVYAQSMGTIVVRSDYNKGGTWSGAVSNLSKNYCPTLCWNHRGYEGNAALIQKGAIPIDETWNGDLQAAVTEQKQVAGEQMSFF